MEYLYFVGRVPKGSFMCYGVDSIVWLNKKEVNEIVERVGHE